MHYRKILTAFYYTTRTQNHKLTCKKRRVYKICTFPFGLDLMLWTLFGLFYMSQTDTYVGWKCLWNYVH